MADNLLKDIFNLQHNALSATSAKTQEDFTNGNLMLLISNIILQFGVPINTKGYSYLREAIIMKMNEPKASLSMTKTLYPSVADKYHTSATRVERAIRHGIETAWKKKEQSSHNDIISSSFSHFQKRPTNSEFIAMIADRIMLLKI